MSTLSHTPYPGKIETLFLYKQPEGTQPSALSVPAGMVRVEIMVAGEAWYDCHADEMAAIPGDLLWHAEGNYTIGRTEPKGYTCLAINLLDPMGHGKKWPRANRWENPDAARSFATDLLARWNEAGERSPAFDAWVTGRLICEIINYQNNLTIEAIDPRLQRAREELEHRFAEDLSVEAIAEKSGWGRAQFYRRFHRAFKTSPRQYLIQVRLKAARQFLLETSNPIKWIAAECGFHSPSAFCAAFREAEGMSPGSFRRRYQRMKKTV